MNENKHKMNYPVFACNWLNSERRDVNFGTTKSNVSLITPCVGFPNFQKKKKKKLKTLFIIMVLIYFAHGHS